MPGSSPLLEVVGLSAGWGDRTVVHDVSLTVYDGELLALLGPNGSGKTTLLRTIAGFLTPTSGTIRLGGASLAGVPPHRRGVGLLFQEPTLFPHRTVYENVGYAPLLARRPVHEVRSEVEELSRLLDLDALLDRSPEALSGGERQRVALARTLAARPRLVLLDEPFASVDPSIRGALHAQFRRALRARGTSAIPVTHDREEGFFLGDRVALLFEGTIESAGPPADVFASPPTERAARFLGYNVLSGPEGPVAVLPEEIRLSAEEGRSDRYSVLAAGPTGHGYRAILGNASGERVEVRASEPLPLTGEFRLAWTREVRLPSGDTAAVAPQSPRRPVR